MDPTEIFNQVDRMLADLSLTDPEAEETEEEASTIPPDLEEAWQAGEMIANTFWAFIELAQRSFR